MGEIFWHLVCDRPAQWHFIRRLNKLWTGKVLSRGGITQDPVESLRNVLNTAHLDVRAGPSGGRNVGKNLAKTVILHLLTWYHSVLLEVGLSSSKKSENEPDFGNAVAVEHETVALSREPVENEMEIPPIHAEKRHNHNQI
jgi:hypothetical protein